MELLAVEEQEPVPWRQDRRDRRSGRRVGDQGVHGLALVGGEGGDVDEGCHVVVRAGLGDDCATVGMPDQDARAVLGVQDELVAATSPSRDRVGFWTMLTANPSLTRRLYTPLPAGAVNEAAMDEDHAVHSIPLSLCDTSCTALIRADLKEEQSCACRQRYDDQERPIKVLSEHLGMHPAVTDHLRDMRDQPDVARWRKRERYSWGDVPTRR